jgi:hypothetical protein
LKTYNQTNFFKHTFCEFTQINNFQFPENTNYKSKSESTYFYTNEGVYRKSNHWGRVANCRWKLLTNTSYKNQEIVIGFANWSNFHPINSSEKIFFIDVNFHEELAKINADPKNKKVSLYHFNEAQKKIKQINHLFKNDKWASYYNEDIETIRKKMIETFINSNKSLQEIKASFK